MILLWEAFRSTAATRTRVNRGKSPKRTFLRPNLEAVAGREPPLAMELTALRARRMITINEQFSGD